LNAYRLLSGRRLDLSALTAPERSVLDELVELYRRRPAWDAFARAWPALARERVWGHGKVPVGSVLYRVAQDLELRLGIAEKRVAPPDYRDCIADLIEERFASRYAFCKSTGIDQGNLSHVLVGSKHFSPETLARVLAALGVTIELVQPHELVDYALELFDEGSPTERLRELDRRIEQLEAAGARARGELATVLDEKARVAREIADAAERRRDEVRVAG
jgi:hypothetical protein